MIDLKKIVEDKIEKIDRQIKQAASERDESATPMESAHDQTRQIANQLYNSLLEEKKRFVELKAKVRKFTKVYEVTTNSGEVKRYMIVPDGLGGVTIDGIILVSEKAPLAKELGI